MKKILLKQLCNFKMCGGKIFNSFFSFKSALTLLRSTAIAANVFGLCVSLPLHKCSNYRQELMGQIAQNPC